LTRSVSQRTVGLTTLFEIALKSLDFTLLDLQGVFKRKDAAVFLFNFDLKLLSVRVFLGNDVLVGAGVGFPLPNFGLKLASVRLLGQ
jgi:hypothetical protein